MAYSKTYDSVLNEVAAKLEVNPEDLKSLIQFESSWDPKAYNKSGAVGLLQFMPVTLKKLHLLSPEIDLLVPSSYDAQVSDDVKAKVKADFLSRFPDVTSQLRGPVLSYLFPQKPFPSLQSLTMAVFYPAYRNVAPDTLFNAKIQAQNPGITKVQDYVDKVLKKKVSFKVA